MNPTVSFVVPCYKLAHLLPQCVESILSQTYGDVEVIIMDDCSPDNTPEVARSFADPRVKYVRNDPNLGHLRNYNKGISLSQGKYIWLISADDLLSKPHVVRKYVDFAESHPSVGYVFCPGTGYSNDGKELGLLKYSVHGSEDKLIKGHDFFERLLRSNAVLAAAGMVRKEVYEKLGAFPVDMPFGGDWYLWLLFSLHYDVGYLAEPMVYYRQHTMSMTNILNEKDPSICTKDDLRVLWQIKRRTEEARQPVLAQKVDEHIIDRSALFLSSERNKGATAFYSFENFEESMKENAATDQELKKIRSRVYARVADETFWAKDFSQSSSLYRRSLQQDFVQPKVWLQSALLSVGAPGIRLREFQQSMRRWLSDLRSH